ncbi:hypothetical protein MD588_08465 [Photobacterium sp. SDRW27]|uniref:hypothetical protein n=1 Tax=Photobacterium obscurum TaxID=2829490 RepID=UPI00224437BF|nr:hypothetical protein [Photobacterium obscurum]MCW8328841.1 hypothetical protein [Photobacterium obscurum]
MIDLIALIVTALLLSPFYNILDIDRTLFSVPLDEVRLISSLATFFVIYYLLRWLMAKFID